MAEQDSAQIGKKREKWKTLEMGMPRRAYLSTSQRRWPTRNFQKESELKEGKNEKKQKRDLPRRWEQDMLCLQKSKTGEPTVP